MKFRIMKWISCKDKMPSLHDNVLIYIDDVEDCPNFAVGYLESDGNFYYSQTEDDIDCISDDLVTHWMELPNKPEAE